MTPAPPSYASTVGLAVRSRDRGWPLTGIRHIPVGRTNGWYLWWGGERSDSDDFFEPLHVEHLPEWCPEALRYLALPPGWGFIIAPDYEDVWYDTAFLVE